MLGVVIRRDIRRVRLGAVTIVRDLRVGRRFVVDSPCTTRRTVHAGKRCTLLAPGVVAWDDTELGDRVPVRFDDGRTAPVLWYFLRPLGEEAA